MFTFTSFNKGSNLREYGVDDCVFSTHLKYGEWAMQSFYVFRLVLTKLNFEKSNLTK